MSGDKKSEFGVSKVRTMTTVALQEALKWHEDLMDHFHKGRRHKERAVRYDLSKASGVPESYLVRLAHKYTEMRSIDGEIYRLLLLAHAKYVCACERIEDAADAMRVERLKLEAQPKNENNQGHRDMAEAVGTAAQAAAFGEKLKRHIGESGLRGKTGDRPPSQNQKAG